MPERRPDSSEYKPGGNDSAKETGGEVRSLPGIVPSQAEAEPASHLASGEMPPMPEGPDESVPSSEPLRSNEEAKDDLVTGDRPEDVPSATMSEERHDADEPMEHLYDDQPTPENAADTVDSREEVAGVMPSSTVIEEGHEAEKVEQSETSGQAEAPRVGLNEEDILKATPAGLAALSAGGVASSIEAQAEHVSYEGMVPPEEQHGEMDLRDEAERDKPDSAESKDEARENEQPATPDDNLDPEKVAAGVQVSVPSSSLEEGAPAAAENQEPIGSDGLISAENNAGQEKENAEPAPVTEAAGATLNGLEEIVTDNGEEVEVREEVVDDLAHIIESIIFASDEPLSVATIKSVLDAAHTFGRVNPDMITARINALNAKYEADGSGFYIVDLANGYQYATRKEMAQWVSYLFKERSKRKLSNSALETVAIVAYKQPITKPEIEAIRGVSVDYTLHSLLEKEIVTVVGRAESVGRPLLYGTTQKFLKIFALKNIDDLPKLREIEEIIKEIKSRGAEESIQLEITALGESSAPEPAPESETKPEVTSENGTK